MKDEIIAGIVADQGRVGPRSELRRPVLCRELRERQATSHAQVVDRSAGASAIHVQTEGTMQ